MYFIGTWSLKYTNNPQTRKRPLILEETLCVETQAFLSAKEPLKESLKEPLQIHGSGEKNGARVIRVWRTPKYSFYLSD